MSARDNRGPIRRSTDDGAALIMVIVWGVVLLALAGVLAQATFNAIRPSVRSEQTYAALAAAEAGIEDYRARLLADNRYFLRGPDATNPALTGWAAMPGGPTLGEFSYAVDSSRALSAGELRISSTGRAGDVTRTVEAVLTKRSTLDYVYVSDIETTAPLLPGAYGDPTTAASLCVNRRWAEAGQVSKAGSSPLTGTHRNSNFCRWAGIYSSERLVGRVHTNDVWYLDPSIPNIDPNSTGGNASAVFDGEITVSCPPPTPTTAGCPDAQRWIPTSNVNSNSTGTWSTSTSTGTLYRTDEITKRYSGTSASYPNRLWNPKYDSILEIPTSNTRMKEIAQSGGCVFTGPTRIRFRADGTIEVTSPNTKSTTALCGGTSLYANPATPASQPTFVRSLADMTAAGFNGVIFVQGTQAAGVGDANYSAPGSSATCQKKTTTAANAYPFVIPSREAAELFRSTYTGKKGFPSEQYSSTSAWFDCELGDAFVQGEYSGAVTVATDHNIVLTGHTKDALAPFTSTSDPNYGMPPLVSNNLLGLVPTQFLVAYRPLRSSIVNGSTVWNSTADWRYDLTRDVIYNFAAVILNECFGTMDATATLASGDANASYNGLGSIYLRGSLGQKYRCPVGTTAPTAYGKNYKYDQRFTVEDPPPYMLELSSEPWKVESRSSTNIRRDPVAVAELVADAGTQVRNSTRSWDVLANDSTGGRLTSVQVARGQGSASVQNGQVSFVAPPTLGQTVLEYIVTMADGTRVAQQLVITLL